MLYRYVPLSFCLFLIVACKKDPTPYFRYETNGLTYVDGDAVVNDGVSADITFDIENNLNVDGNVTIIEGISIGNDLNLNAEGLALITLENTSDSLEIFGNTNINDSLLITSGCVFIYGTLNVNSGGVLNVTDSAKVVVEEDLNNSGIIHGNRNITVQGTLHPNTGTL